MPEKQYGSPLLDQTKDLIWAVDHHFCLVYANKAYLNLMKEVTGKEKKLNEPIFIEGFGDGFIEKWKAYYERGLHGEQFEIEEHFYNPYTNQVEYSQISFNPIIDENQQVVNIACQSRDITSFIKSNSEAEILLDASLDVICSIDEQGNFTKVNAACKELWGYEKHELIGKAYISFVIEADIEKTNLVAADIIAGKSFTTFENRYKRKDGGIAFNVWSARWDAKAQIMFCVARDAREKIRKEELLIESENRFKALVQEGSDLIGILDEAGLYTYVSPTSMGILGINPEDFIGKNAFDFIHPEDAEKTLNSLSKIASESRVEVEPFRFKNKNGEWRWIETVLTNMLNNPAIRGIIANSRDITAKRKETQHLKLLESVITNTKDAVLITEAEPFDEPGPKIIYVNEAFTKMTGYTAEEVIGKTPRILQGPKSDKAALAKLSKAIRKWEPCEITTINYKKNGEEFWINFAVSPVVDETGWCTHWIAIERDVTENKKIELANNLTSKISSIFNREPDLSSALGKLCEEVAVFGHFSFSEIWLTDIQVNLLELKTVHKNDEAAHLFYENSKFDTVIEKGQGLPDKIWENNQSIIWEYKGKNQELLFRSAAAEQAGIKTIVGFPLMYHEKFIGVLQIGTQATTKNVDWIINALDELVAFIGTEIARKKTEIELKKIFEFAPDIIAITGFDGYIKQINPYTCKLLGYAENELMLKPFSAHIHPDDMKKSVVELSKLSSGSPLYNWVNRHITKSGDILTISWNASPSLEDGLIFCIGKDITEEVKIGSLLKASNQLSRIGSWEVDLINNAMFWSDITHEIHQTPENFRPQLIEAIHFYREDFRELATEAVNACIETGTPFDFEAIIVTNKNKEVWVRAMGRAEIVDGKCVRIFGSFQDIHERKLSQLELLEAIKKAEESDARFKSYTQQSPIAIYTTDINGDCVYANETWLEIAGMQLEDALSKGWINALHPEDLEYVTNNWYKSIESNGEWNYEYRFVNSNKNIIWVNGNAKKLFNDKNELIGYLGSNVNITERKKAEQEKNSLLTTLEKSLNEIYVFNAETLKFSYVNQGALLNIGYSETEIKELTPLDLKPAFTATTFNQLVNPLVTKEKEKIIFNTNHKRKNGTLYPVEVHLQFVNEGNNKKFLAVILDITDLKKTEQLLDSASKLARVGSWELVVQDNGELKMFWSGMTKNILEIDESFEPTLAYGLSLHKEPSRSLVEAAMNKLMQSGEAFDLELELLTAKGNDIWVRCIGDAQLENGKVNRIYGSFQDIHERKVNEIALRESLKTLEDYKFSLDQSAIVAYTDSNGVISFVNDNFCKISQYSKEELIGKTHQIINSRHHPKEFFVDLWKTISSGNVWRGEIKNAAKDGSYYWVDTTIVPFLDENNKPIQYLAIRFDVTDRKIAEDIILKTLEEKTSILERITEAFVSLDANWCYTYMNKQAGEIFNRDPEKIIGKHIWTEFPEGLNQPFHLAYEKAMATQEYIHVEEHYKPYDLWFENHIYPSPDGISIFFRDVTERKRSEKKLEMANDRFEKVTEATNDVIWDWDIESDTFLRSNAIDNFFGVGTSKLLEKKDFWKDNFHKEDISKIKSSIQKALEDPDCNRWEEEYRIFNNNNEIVFVIDRGLILRNKNGKAIRMVGAMTNITEQKKQEGKLIELNQSLNEQASELKRSNEELEQFAFVASHDLQEPLRMITSFLDQLKRKYADRLDEKALQYIHFATDGAKRMKQIILDLLLYSRANKPTEQNELINLNEIVSEYTQLRRKVVAEKKATITFHGLPSIETNRAPITQIFHCLLDNALKYVDENKPPNIEIGAIEKENAWQFAIKDNGIGIDPKFFDKIFLIFQRLQNRKEQDGTGIGLTVAKRSIEFLGGEIWVESEINKGSTFYFTIRKIK